MPYKDPAAKREYQRIWAVTKRAATRAAYLADKSCVSCGSTEALEIDHIDPASKTTHRIWTWPPERRAQELAKCQVLCRSCHDTKCATEGYDRTQRHSRSRYAAGCRCQLCRNANTAHAQLVRANRRARRQAAVA